MNNLLRVLALSALLMFLLCGVSFADGTFTDLKNAIDGTPAGGTLTLSQDYTYDISADAAPLSNDGVPIKKAITIDGNNKTVSGSGKTRVFKISGVSGDKALTVKNLTITKGGNSKSGAALYVDLESRANFVNCTITKNGTVAGTHTKDGGAIYVFSKAVVSFEDCTISNNLGADRAAGVYLIGNGTFVNCRIVDNVGASRGGGIYVDPGYKSPQRGGDWGGNVTMRNCIITGNKGGRGGGVYVNSENDKLNVFENCVISSNDVSANSIGNCGGILFYNAKGRVTGCTISDNKAVRGGGVIVDVLSEVAIDNCTITGNRATGPVGGGILCHDGSHPDDPMKLIGNINLSRSTVKDNAVSMDLSDDICINWSTNTDKSKDVVGTIGSWVARYDGKISSLGSNTIGVLTNPKNFTRAVEDKIANVRAVLPEGHADLPPVMPPVVYNPSSGPKPVVVTVSEDITQTQSPQDIEVRPDADGAFNAHPVVITGIPLVIDVKDQGNLEANGIKASVDDKGRLVLTGEPRDVGVFFISVGLPDGTRKEVKIEIKAVEKSVTGMVNTAPEAVRENWSATLSGDSAKPRFEMYFNVNIPETSGFDKKAKSPSVVFEGASGKAEIVTVANKGGGVTQQIKVTGTADGAAANVLIKAVKYRVGAVEYVQSTNVKLTDTKLTDQSTAGGAASAKSSSGGCSTGFGVIALFAASALIRRKSA